MTGIGRNLYCWEYCIGDKCKPDSTSALYSFDQLHPSRSGEEPLKWKIWEFVQLRTGDQFAISDIIRRWEIPPDITVEMENICLVVEGRMLVSEALPCAEGHPLFSDLVSLVAG